MSDQRTAEDAARCKSTFDVGEPVKAGVLVYRCERKLRHTGKHQRRDEEGRLFQWWGSTW